MIEKDFRRLALALPEAVESAHMQHPDSRVGGRIFATLGHPAKGWGMVKLHPEQQHYFSKAEPDVYVPVKGAWGRRGATSVQLKAARTERLQKAIRAAWLNTAPKRLAAQLPKDFEARALVGPTLTQSKRAPRIKLKIDSSRLS